MAQQQRIADNLRSSQGGLGSGPMLARIVSHLDPSFMGGIEVSLLRYQGNTMGDEAQTFTVFPATPFFGSTAYEFTGQNETDYNDTQKSYGMWMVPPDVGVTVIVVFIDGDPSKGYYIGCVPPRFANHMVPALGASDKVALSADDKKRLNTTQPLPVAEVNKRLLQTNAVPNNIDNVKKPLHPIAEHFLVQGTLEDDVRGPTTTTSRREVPSAVYGISTPGPLDKRQGAKRAVIGKNQSTTPRPVPVSRLGGTQFVMDDGDDRYQRKTPASEGPVEYADVLNKEKGVPTIPYSEYFRVRTRTGHQILMHNSEDLIYIGNSRGTTWIELTSNGKIDIYAEDSVSIHSQNDLNFRADRDINFEAGRNVSIKATAEYQSPDSLINEKSIQDANELENGRIQLESAFNTKILVGANMSLETREYLNENGDKIDGSLDINIKGNTKIATGTGTVETMYKMDVHTNGNLLVKTTNNVDINSTGHNWLTAGGTTEIKSGGDHIETAPNIHMNGPTASTALEAEIAGTIKDLLTHENVRTLSTEEWKDTKYQTESIQSIMRRVPMHEPWPLHENQAPQILKPENTDRESEV